MNEQTPTKPRPQAAPVTWAPSQTGPCARCHLLCTDSELGAVIEAPAEDLHVSTSPARVLGYGRADAVPSRAGI